MEASVAMADRVCDFPSVSNESHVKRAAEEQQRRRCHLPLLSSVLRLFTFNFMQRFKGNAAKWPKVK